MDRCWIVWTRAALLSVFSAKAELTVCCRDLSFPFFNIFLSNNKCLIKKCLIFIHIHFYCKAKRQLKTQCKYEWEPICSNPMVPPAPVCFQSQPLCGTSQLTVWFRAEDEHPNWLHGDSQFNYQPRHKKLSWEAKPWSAEFLSNLAAQLLRMFV